MKSKKSEKKEFEKLWKQQLKDWQGSWDNQSYDTLKRLKPQFQRFFEGGYKYAKWLYYER